ncbi:M3 family metallopeptidase [Actinocrinis puniceicyclus]|uniref:M3 family metallopeptidase n=1 Tax=Actinocrinis puniceicyclus TaxID=977794 RepID=A0A8J7WRU3_9ACTN|nr:M3 family metallopeptidase [Actinocrinis puniceicyclus]MBS2966378.1 M3 family metallopeptidase [Actinocrinis puniceicyclus]
MSANPFLTQSALPYQLPPFAEIRESHYAAAFSLGMEQQAAQLAAITAETAPASYDNTVLALERSGEVLRRVTAAFNNQASSDTTPTVQDLQAEFEPRLTAHRDAILLNPTLFGRVHAVREAMQQAAQEAAPTTHEHGAMTADQDARGDRPTAEATRLVDRYYTDFVRAGALLGTAAQGRLRELNTELARLTSAFERNLLADTRERAVVFDNADELEGLSHDALSAAHANASARGLRGKYLLSLQLPTNQLPLASLARRTTRERLYNASISRGTTVNRSLVVQIARLRAERAALLGYPSHAAYVVAEQTARSVENVESLLHRLVEPAMANARSEAEALQEAFTADGHDTADFAPWDWQYYAEKVRKARFDVDAADLRPYFSLERVLRDGVFFAAQQLYGLRFEEREDLVAYHDDARVFEVFEQDGRPLGLFIADCYARESKRGGAWMNYLVKPCGLFDTKPVVVNNLNLAKPAAGEPTLLAFDEVRTLFHEFGHALHGLFMDVHTPRLADVPNDFVEYPSQVNEMWMARPEVLANYAKHHRTGEPIPATLVSRMQEAARFGQGFKTVEYLGAALLDWAWHTITPGTDPGDALEFEANALNEAGIAFPWIPPRYRSTYFAHVFYLGYDAGYYSYIWSEILDADTVDWFTQNGGLRRENGERFRRVLLSRGESVDPMEAFRQLRGRDPLTGPLLERRGLAAARPLDQP